MVGISRWLSLVVLAVAACPSGAAELNKYLPDDTEIVLGINVTTLMDSALVQKQVPALLKKCGADLVKLGVEANGQKLDAELLKTIARTFTDADAVQKWIGDNKHVVQRVLIGTNADYDFASAFVIFEGDFKKDRLRAVFDDIARFKPFGIVVKTVKVDKQEFYSVKVPGDDSAMFVALADDKNIICCEDKDALAKALSREKNTLHKELIEVATKIDAKAGLWMAAAPKEMDEFVQSHGSVVVTDGIKVLGSVMCKDADGAKNMASDLKESLLDVADLLDDNAKQFPPLGAVRDILKKVSAKAEKNVTTVEIDLPAAVAEKIIKELPVPR
jgi:hypothetical protein